MAELTHDSHPLLSLCHILSYAAASLPVEVYSVTSAWQNQERLISWGLFLPVGNM